MPGPRVTPFRQQVQALLRESILDAAWNRVMNDDWDRVRVGEIAADVGVSRQTVHNEFGTKQQLAVAMFHREMETYIDGICEVTAAAETLEDSIRNSFTWLFEQARSHDLLVRMLADAHEGRSTALLPMLTTNAYLIVRPMRDTLTDLYMERWPGDRAVTQRVIDFAMRLSISHVLLPSDFAEEQVIEDLVSTIIAALRDHAAGDRDAHVDA